MGFVDAVKTVYTNYVNLQGRSGRAEFWWYFLFYLVVGTILYLINDFLYFIFVLGSFLPSLGVTVRRLHDTGHTGWLVLLLIIPLVNIIAFFVLLFISYIKPSAGPNQYGPPAEGGGAMPMGDDSTTV
ncbi:DUF805 domain-containing protein [Parvularcula flava]|uniref:DUF805 domain-containing protein n=1 Tax=Aquisalinus luteolus TaxID=1566827 RepID=A0A8J3ESF8_9PROT|nr:DUF805 domain-containing protein [Aquisalinus luteolus]NHK29348.1 DUF805 domain-containing protein [Aquisalinus luteolus]GGI01055.1 hypothetical protein GCM10011355_30790 [Aquisalinus luteolus]